MKWLPTIFPDSGVYSGQAIVIFGNLGLKFGGGFHYPFTQITNLGIKVVPGV
jgi:hypothetical protein